MLQFTASWCGVCRKEMPFIEKDIWLKLKGNSKFILFGIDLKESKETVEKFAKETKSPILFYSIRKVKRFMLLPPKEQELPECHYRR